METGPWEGRDFGGLTLPNEGVNRDAPLAKGLVCCRSFTNAVASFFRWAWWRSLA